MSFRSFIANDVVHSKSKMVVGHSKMAGSLGFNLEDLVEGRKDVHFADRSGMRHYSLPLASLLVVY